MSDSSNLPLNLSEIANHMGSAISNGETIAQDAGTVIVHGFHDIETEAKPVEIGFDLEFHARLIKIEDFIIKLEERMRVLRFW